MKSKKITAVFIAALLTLPLAGCKNKTEDYLSLAYKYNLDEYITLGEYKGLTYDTASITVTEEEVTSEINNEILNNNLAVNDTSSTSVVKDGDTVNIDFTGYIDGKAFEGGTAKGTSLTIGSGKFISGFEDGLIGTHPGDKVSLDLKFPDNYHKQELRGVAVIFEVTVNSISVIPELTSDIISAISEATVGEKYTSAEEYKSYIMYTFANNKKQNVMNNLLQTVVNTSTVIKYPQTEYDAYYENMMKYYETYAKQQQITLEEYITKRFDVNIDTFYEECKKSSQNQIALQMAAISIARKEGLNFTQKEFDKAVENLVSSGGYKSVENLYEENGEPKVITWIFMDKTQNFIFDNASAK